MSQPQQEYEMPEKYKRDLAQLSQFLEDREAFRQQIKDGIARGVRVSPADKAMTDEKLRELDRAIHALEQALAEEYDRYQAEMAKEADTSKSIAAGWEATKRLYIIIKHQKPHLLEGFTEAAFGPLTPEQREEFLDGVAILESTKLDAILNGEDS